MTWIGSLIRFCSVLYRQRDATSCEGACEGNADHFVFHPLKISTEYWSTSRNSRT